MIDMVLKRKTDNIQWTCVVSMTSVATCPTNWALCVPRASYAVALDDPFPLGSNKDLELQ